MQIVFTVANIYFSNQEQLRFLSCVTAHLEYFGTTNLILGGDLNVQLILRLDSSTCKSSLTPSTLTQIISLLTQLSNVWQVLHPSVWSNTTKYH